MSASLALAVLAGALAGCGLLLAPAAVRGSFGRPAAAGAAGGAAASRRGGGAAAWLGRVARDLAGARGAAALVAGLAAVVATRWVVAGAGVALVVLGWRGLGGAAGERGQLARLESLATWTESLRDTVAGAVGLEQAIPASLRAAAPAMRPPLGRLVDRLMARAPMADALRLFAEDLGDATADLVIAALVMNAQLRGPGLRDLLGSLARSVRDELEVRRRVNAERRSTRRGAQIVVGVSVGLALALAVFDRGYVQVYGSVSGQLVLALVAGLYAAGMGWMRRLARSEPPARLLAAPGAQAWGGARGAPAQGAGARAGAP